MPHSSSSQTPGDSTRKGSGAVRSAAVIGLGYVGLPLLVEIARAGIEATGIDLTLSKIEEINAGRSYIPDVESAEVERYVRAGRLRATTDFDALREVDAISICVPTPLRKTHDPDMSYIISAVEQIAPRLRRGQIIILESTTYPGTTDEILLPQFQKEDFRVGEDFFLAFSPERVDPGNPVYKTKNTPKVVGGVTPECSRRAAAFYGQIFDQVIPVSSTRAAEMVKLLENTFRAVNIGLVNEVALMCNRLGLDVWEVIGAAATKPFGFMPFYPGPGLGGHCIPIDPIYLSWKLKTLNYTARFIELATEVNSSMPGYVVTRAAQALNQVRKPLNGSRILIAGVAYKPNVSDTRESPALDIIHLLRESGAEVSYHDPFVPELDERGAQLRSTALTPETLRALDLVIIVTNHKVLDLRGILEHAPLVFDTRNATREFLPHPRVIRL